MGLVLAKKIFGCHPDGFQSFTIVGRRGIGKSSYSLHALHEVFMKLGYTDNEAWRMALSCLKFSIEDVVRYLREAIDLDHTKVCLIWDDVGIHAAGSKYFLNMKLVDTLKGVMDSVRTAVNSLILTCPSTSGLLNLLKHYDDYMIKISYGDRGGYYRVAHGYLWNTLPGGQKRIYKKFIDDYSCYLPVWVYEEYMRLRKAALRDVLGDLEQIVKK
jgi:hypothetical protein